MNDHASSDLVREVVEPIYRGKLWMQVIGVFLIISGILTALTLIGLIVAWIPIWGGVALMQAASASARAYENQDLREAVYLAGKIKLHFKIFGIALLVYLAIVVVAFIFGGISFMTMHGL